MTKTVQTLSTKRKISLGMMALIYVAAGLMHLFNPTLYLPVMPSWVPEHMTMIYLSGVLELVLGVAVCFPGARRYAAWGLILLLIAVYPANIQMAINYYKASNPHLWIAIVRLPLQFLLIWWAYTFTRLPRLKA